MFNVGIRMHMKLSSIIVLILLTLLGCQGPKESSLPISNRGVRFDMQMDVARLFITGDPEKNILRMDTPPLAELLKSLEDQDKWKSAHVLLTLRYQQSCTCTMDEWNGMNHWAMPNDEKEMHKVSTYWHQIHEQGDLGQAGPPFTDELIDFFSYTEPKPLPDDAIVDGEMDDLFGPIKSKEE